MHVEYPEWVDEVVDWNRRCDSDEARMRVAIARDVLRDDARAVLALYRARRGAIYHA